MSAVPAAGPGPAFYSREYNNRALVPDNEAWVRRWIDDSARARTTMTAQFDLRYGDGPGETLDLYPSRKGDGTCLVFIHGGYWRSRDKSEFAFLAPAWVAAGVSLAVVNYDLCPAVTVEEIVRQMLRAGRWLWLNAERLGMDEDRLYVSGHSAGGHLAAMMMAAVWPALDARLPRNLYKGALAISGLYDLRPIAQVDWLNADTRLDEASALRVSPAYLPPATRAPVATCVGGAESSEFKRQNALLRARWRDVAGEDVAAPGAHHFSVLAGLADPSSALFGAARRLMRLDE